MGILAAVGDRVKGLKPGDRVYALGFLNPKGGFYAEYAAVKADDVSRIPDELTTQQAGAMPVDAMTALGGLDDTLALKPGESVMIFGASGGIGHLAVQLEKLNRLIESFGVAGDRTVRGPCRAELSA